MITFEEFIEDIEFEFVHHKDWAKVAFKFGSILFSTDSDDTEFVLNFMTHLSRKGQLVYFYHHAPLVGATVKLYARYKTKCDILGTNHSDVRSRFSNIEDIIFYMKNRAPGYHFVIGGESGFMLNKYIEEHETKHPISRVIFLEQK